MLYRGNSDLLVKKNPIIHMPQIHFITHDECIPQHLEIYALFVSHKKSS